MPSLPLRLSLLLLALGLGGCDDAPRFTKPEPGEARSGGATTVRKSDQNAFSMPSANLSPTRRLDFSVGNSFFRSPWVIAPSTTTARDSLVPLTLFQGLGAIERAYHQLIPSISAASR